MINLSKTQVSWDSQVIAFKWYQNIGDALSHFAHFSSFKSEAQREEALQLIDSYTKNWRTKHEDLIILEKNVIIAPIKSDKPTIAKV
jgi:hypothetical protein